MKYLMIFILLLIAFQINANASIKLERVKYKGWRDCYRFTAGNVRLVVVPDIGSRIMEYSINGKSVIWENTKESGKTYQISCGWHNYGGYKFWLGPEGGGRIAGSGEPMMEQGKANAEELKTPDGRPLLKITNAPGIRSGTLVTQEISMEENGDVNISCELKSISANPISYCAWDVTQVKTPCFVGFPINPQSIFDGGLQYIVKESKNDDQFKVIDGLCVVQYKGRMGKIGADSNRPFMFYAKGKLGYAKLFSPMIPGLKYADGGCNAEIWTNPKEDNKYLEMEILSNIAELKTGETLKSSEKWRIFELEKEVNDEAGFVSLIKKMQINGKFLDSRSSLE